jgi:uncharacterized RDD family membrane protein YckC
MIAEQFQSPEFTISSRKRRIAAFMIDHFIFSFLLVAIIFGSMGSDFMNQENPGKVMSSMLVIMLAGFVLYFAKDSVRGSSPGKWLMGISVRDKEDHASVPSVGRLFLRNLTVVIWPVEFIVLVANGEKRRLGDQLANTVVVKSSRKMKVLPIVLIAIAGVLLFFFSMFFMIVGFMKNSDAYKTAIREIEQNKEIIEETGGIKGYGIMPTGSINIANGEGEAQLQIKVLGNKKNLVVDTYLTKQDGGAWKLQDLEK